MRFFTPDLYLRYNAEDDAEADRAHEEWEQTLRAYRQHLKKHSRDWNARARELAETLCLHDWELLSVQEDVPDACTAPLPLGALPIGTVSLGAGVRVLNLVYLLWGEIAQSAPPDGWPFSGDRVHWLYDELDVARRPPATPLYWHRVLLSDGRVLAIPFFDIVIQSFSTREPEAALVTRRRA